MWIARVRDGETTTYVLLRTQPSAEDLASGDIREIPAQVTTAVQQWGSQVDGAMSGFANAAAALFASALPPIGGKK